MKRAASPAPAPPRGGSADNRQTRANQKQVQVASNGTPTLFKGLVPRYVSPAVLDHLRRSGAKFETGAADYHRHVLEVFTTSAGAEVLERHGVATRLVKRGASWPDARLAKAAGRAAFLGASAAAANDPLEVAFRAYAADVQAGWREPL